MGTAVLLHSEIQYEIGSDSARSGQLAFILDRVKALAPQHPEWKEQMPFRAVLSGDLNAIAASGERGLVEMVMATHADMTSEQFNTIVTEWIATAKHPVYKRPYTECVYLPMLELLNYLRSHEFKTFIVSGGGIEFMRPWVEQVYGIPPEQVIGSSIKLKYEPHDGVPPWSVCRKSILSMTRQASPWGFIAISVAAPSWRSAIRMATIKCSSMSPQEPVPASG